MTNTLDEKFGQTLKKLRTERGISQEDFAGNIELHRTYISLLERGLKSPTLRTIAKICNELDISLVQLMQHLESDTD